MEQSEILEEQRFHASFEVNICRKGEAEEFLRCIASKNGTDFKAPRKEKIRMGYSSNRYNCGRKASLYQMHTYNNTLKGNFKICQTKGHTSCLSFLYASTLLGLMILHSKVLKFAKYCVKNYTLFVKLHTVCKNTHCM